MLDGGSRGLVGARATLIVAALAFALLGGGCATLPPGMDAPKPASTALGDPDATTLGKRLAASEKAHPGLSGFHLLIDGTDSFALHIEIADKAERTLDVQYFLLRQDDTGKLILESLLRAATCTPSTRDLTPRDSRLADAYSVLGVSADASEGAIRSAYRQLVRENHPDRLASKGLPESMRAVVEERAREIHAAFDLIRQTRQFA